MTLEALYRELATVFDDNTEIERHARDAVLSSAASATHTGSSTALQPALLAVLADPAAHPVCRSIAALQLPWAPPQTSSDALYIQHSVAKVHVELVGPNGFARSDSIRVGLYGMLPNAEYGVRTHPAEEIYIMLAGQAYWKRDTAPYTLLSSGDRSYHPSMMEHANRTSDHAFMSIYVWHGDISTSEYIYQGT